MVTAPLPGDEREVPWCIPCDQDMTYRRQAPRPGGLAFVYACERCGETDTVTVSDDDGTEWRSR